MTWLFRLGLFFAVIGAMCSAWPSDDIDVSYMPVAGQRTFGRRGPALLIDEAHFNAHTESGRFAPFARLLTSDGYRVGGFGAPFSATSLERCDILVVANALGVRGWLQHLANLMGLERHIDLDVRAFTAKEVRAVEEWVRSGGSLLLVADHAPAGEAAADLAAAFGVRMRRWWVEDPEHSDPTFSNRGFLVFSGGNGLLADTPITRGRTPAERVGAVMTFTGQALDVPPGAMPLLRLSNSAREYPFRSSRDDEGRTAAGLAQALALRHGAGRVVVIGEAAALSAQQAHHPSGERLLFGMNRRGNHNKQFVLNVMHWLSGLLD